MSLRDTVSECKSLSTSPSLIFICPLSSIDILEGIFKALHQPGTWKVSKRERERSGCLGGY